MNIAILGGTGKEGAGLATRWALVGHAIIIGSRDAARRAARVAGPRGGASGGRGGARTVGGLGLTGVSASHSGGPGRAAPSYSPSLHPPPQAKEPRYQDPRPPALRGTPAMAETSVVVD